MPSSTRWSVGWVGSAETGNVFLIGGAIPGLLSWVYLSYSLAPCCSTELGSEVPMDAATDPPADNPQTGAESQPPSDAAAPTSPSPPSPSGLPASPTSDPARESL